MNLMRQYLLILLGLLCLLTACSSTKKKAQENLEAGAFEEALNLYQQVLKKDPTDPEAQRGIRSARDGILDKQLISVRMARLASNQQQAIDLLTDVIKREKEWQYLPKSSVAFTQSEESSYAIQYVQERVRNSIVDNKPFRSESFLSTYESIFQDTQGMRSYDRLKKHILQNGQATCLKFQQLDFKKSPYFADFLARFCSHFESECSQCFVWSKIKLNNLYQAIDVTGNVSELPPIFLHVLFKDLTSSFEQTPWFDPQGIKKAALHISGSYAYSHDKNVETQIYNYTVQVPYQTLEYTQQYRQIPYQDYEYKYDAISRQSRSIPVTKYRTESYSVPQSVTRYRSENRSYSYNALKHMQKLSLVLSGNGTLSSKIIDIPFQDASKQEGYEHNINIPNIGLKPSSPNLIDPTSWIMSSSKKAKQQAIDKFKTAWISSFCSIETNVDDANNLADKVQKCMRGNNQGSPAFVREWYENHLGVTYEIAEKLMSQ